jgi:hypothetical protein
MKAVVIYGVMEFAARADATPRRVGGRAQMDIEWGGVLLVKIHRKDSQ